MNLNLYGIRYCMCNCSIYFLQWMNAKTLVTVDTSEKLHLIDVKSEEELEVIDLGDVELVYGSSHFKSLATGGNVSKALVRKRVCVYDLGCYSQKVTNLEQWLTLEF